MKRQWDLLLFLQILAIGTISLLIISSISPVLFRNQLLFWVVGLAILYTVSHLDYSSWQKYSYIFYAGSLVVLLLLLLFGEPIRGSVRWIELVIFRFQPSEIAKVAVILALATFFNQRSTKYFKDVLISLAIVLPAIILIFLEPDIGNTFAFLAIWLGISYAAGMKARHIALLAVSAILSVLIFIQVLAPYQKERLASFIDPLSDPLGTGYNIIQSKIAIGSGQLLGKGYGHGSQSQLQFLPEAESDFIFAAIAEQLGLLGASLILFIFVWLFFKLIRIAQAADRFGQLIVVGATSYLLIQFIVNIGMNMGLFPVTGITLPLVSYGGSSLIINLFILGIIFSITRFSRN